MRRNNDGVLVFDSVIEEEQYNAKKERFLKQTDEQNAAEYHRYLERKYAEVLGGKYERR